MAITRVWRRWCGEDRDELTRSCTPGFEQGAPPPRAACARPSQAAAPAVTLLTAPWQHPVSPGRLVAFRPGRGEPQVRRSAPGPRSRMGWRVRGCSVCVPPCEGVGSGSGAAARPPGAARYCPGSWGLRVRAARAPRLVGMTAVLTRKDWRPFSTLKNWKGAQLGQRHV
jgi:hypothetical protein